MAVRIGKAALLGMWPKVHVVVHAEPQRKGCLSKAERIVFHGDPVRAFSRLVCIESSFSSVRCRICVRRPRSRLETLCSIHDARILMTKDHTTQRLLGG